MELRLFLVCLNVSIFFVLLNISVAKVYRTAFSSATVISSLVLNS